MIHNGKYSKFKSFRIENGIQKFKIVDICGEIINDNPTEEELIDLKQYVRFRERDIIRWPDANRRDYLLEFMKQYVEKMNKYEITDKIQPIFKKWLEDVKNQDNNKETVVREARERLRKYIDNNKRL